MTGEGATVGVTSGTFNSKDVTTATTLTVSGLTPASYTAIVRGKNNTTGVALVEVYGLQ